MKGPEAECQSHAQDGNANQVQRGEVRPQIEVMKTVGMDGAIEPGRTCQIVGSPNFEGCAPAASTRCKRAIPSNPSV